MDNSNDLTPKKEKTTAELEITIENLIQEEKNKLSNRSTNELIELLNTQREEILAYNDQIRQLGKRIDDDFTFKDYSLDPSQSQEDQKNSLINLYIQETNHLALLKFRIKTLTSLLEKRQKLQRRKENARLQDQNLFQSRRGKDTTTSSVAETPSIVEENTINITENPLTLNDNASEAGTSVTPEIKSAVKTGEYIRQPNYKDNYMGLIIILTSNIEISLISPDSTGSLKLSALNNLKSFLADKDESWFSHDENRKQLVVLLMSICNSHSKTLPFFDFNSRYHLLELRTLLNEDITRFGIENNQLDELKPQALNLNKLDLNEFFSVDAPNMNASEANTSKIHNPSTQPNYKDHYMEMLNTLTSYMKKYPMDEFPIISLKLKPLIHLNNFLADKDEAWFSHDENRKQLVILLRSICYSDPEMRTYDAQYPLIELDGFLKRDITRFGIEKTQLDDLEPHELDLSHLDFDEFFSAHAPNMKGTFRK